MAHYEIYCDESRQELFYDKEKSRSGYTLIGGIWLDASQRQRVKSDIKKLREQHGLFSEFKWTKVSEKRLGFYTDVVGYFFRESALKFRTIVLRSDELDAIKFHEGDHELMFYKFYYQLIKHWLEDGNSYRVFVDLKTSRKRDRLNVLRDCLKYSNLAARIEFVQALPSSQVDFLQLADLLIGAVGARFNDQTKSPAKRELLTLAEVRLQRPMNRPTSRDYLKFNVFRWHPGSRW